MPDTVTHDEIARLFQATDARLEELAQVQLLTAEQLKRTDEQLSRTDEQLNRTDEQLNRTDEQLNRTDEQLKRTDEQLQRTDKRVEAMAAEEMERRRWLEEQLADLKVRVDRTTRNVDAITDKWGRFVEGMVVPAAESLFVARGIPVHSASQRVRGRRDGRTMELDVLVENDEVAVVIEAKSTVRQLDVDDQIERMGEVKAFYPRLAQRRLFGAVAGVDVPPDVARYAYRRGLFVLLPSGETMRIANDDGFQPKVW